MRDTEIQKLLEAERERQKSVVNLIASENYVSSDVLLALGSELTNKYAEGYPGARYYGGNEIVDQVENLCKQRALKTFNLEHGTWSVNVQPLSGSPANLAVYLALVPPALNPDGSGKGGKIMGMDLNAGGHLSHGYKVSITGKFWQQVSYGVSRDTELLDYDEIRNIAVREKPAIIVAGFTAYPRIVDWKKFRKIADDVGAYLLVDMSHIAGLVAGGVYPSPFSHADVVTTTTHKTLRGPRSAIIFSRKRELLHVPGSMLHEKIDKAVFPGIQGGPHLNQIAAVAVALHEAMRPDFKTYVKQVVKNAQALADTLASLGWRIVSGGTDTHLLLVDTISQGISGKEASERLEREGIIVNKNTIPFDTRKPTDPSGIRLGTAAETTRGKKEKDFIEIGERIDRTLRDLPKQKN